MSQQPRILEVIEAARQREALAEAARDRSETILEKPSLMLAIEKANARLPRGADGKPYPFYGLFEPYETWRTLGTDAVFYIRVIQEGLVVWRDDPRRGHL